MRECHLVGSVALNSATDVFTTVGQILNGKIKKIPDGETGNRSRWIEFQINTVLMNHSQLEAQPSKVVFFQWNKGLMRILFAPLWFLLALIISRMLCIPAVFSHLPAPTNLKKRQLLPYVFRFMQYLFVDFPAGMPHFRVKKGLNKIEFTEPLGYSKSAIESYQTFKQLKTAGKVPADVKFQVSIPSAWSISCFLTADTEEIIIDAYQRALIKEIDVICKTIPASELAIQIDCALEFFTVELPYEHAHKSDPVSTQVITLEDLAKRLVTMGNSVPKSVDLGYHLCYGDATFTHFKEPTDLGYCVQFANYLASNLNRPLNWIHLPVPKQFHENLTYYSPLKQLKLKPKKKKKKKKKN